MRGLAIPERQFGSAAELRAHYAAVSARLSRQGAIEAPEQRETIGQRGIRMWREAERVRAARQREEEARRVAALVARYRLVHSERCEVKPDQPAKIIARVAAANGLVSEDITGTRRDHRAIAARYAAIAEVANVHPGLSLPQMGRIFRRDHTTILHALRKLGLR